MDELIGKYLAGEASADEVAQVEAWERADVANKKYVDHVKFIFEKASTVKELHRFDEDAAWNKLKEKLKAKDAKTIEFDSQPGKDSKGLQFFLRIAAGIIVLVGIGYVFYQNTNSLPTTVEVVAETKAVGDTLPDGSDVYLNKKTKLVYAYDKKKKSHVVKLKGEAFFTIRHKKKNDFLVETEGIYIRDIGTSFNVKAYPESNTIEVVVKEGAVEFYTDTDSGVYLQAGGKGIYDKVTKKFSVEEPEQNVLSYKTKFFSFNDQDLGSVIQDLNFVYDKQIVLDKRLKNCRLTVTFNEENIEEIGNVIAETLNLSMRESEGKIILEGSGCE
jgi:transmembrane sensor